MFTHQQTYDRIREEIMPYGQYLGLRDVPVDIQPFTTMEVGYCALLIAFWAAKEYASAYISAKAKRSVDAKDDAKFRQLEKAYADLSEHVLNQSSRMEQLEECIDQIAKACQDLDADNIAIKQASKEDLIVLLGHLGLTGRQARKCADGLYPLLETELKPMLTRGVRR